MQQVVYQLHMHLWWAPNAELVGTICLHASHTHTHFNEPLHDLSVTCPYYPRCLHVTVPINPPLLDPLCREGKGGVSFVMKPENDHWLRQENGNGGCDFFFSTAGLPDSGSAATVADKQAPAPPLEPSSSEPAFSW